MAGNSYVDGLWVGPWGSVTACNDDTPFVAGQVGKVVSLGASNTQPAKSYMYVQRRGSDTAQNSSGAVMVWITATQHVAGLGTTGAPAGVFLGDDDNTDLKLKGMQSGKYGFIQVKGIATVAVANSTVGQTANLIGGPACVNTTGVLTTPTTNAPVIGVVLSTTTADTGTVEVLLDLSPYIP